MFKINNIKTIVYVRLIYIMTALYELIHKQFYELGIDLITKPEELVIENEKTLPSLIVYFKGPCGHVRRGTINDSRQFCPKCISLLRLQKQVELP